MRAQHVEGAGDREPLNPDLWTLDRHFLDLPGRDRVMLDLFYDYKSNVALFPTWQACLREHRPPRDDAASAPGASPDHCRPARACGLSRG
jgi:hypothetical protein